VSVDTPRRITEGQLREQVRSLAALFGWKLYFTWSSVNSPRGFPDLCLVRPPRLVFAELKSASGKTTPEQDLWLGELSQVPGVEVHLWRPLDVEEIAEVLR
jgi:hypothetical protein